MRQVDRLNIVGSRVREARLKAKPRISQEDLVARLQVEGYSYMDQSKISRIESGDRPVYDYEVVALAKALGITTQWLLEGHE